MKKAVVHGVAFMLLTVVLCGCSMQPAPSLAAAIDTPYPAEATSFATPTLGTSAAPKFIKPTKEYYEKGKLIEVEIDYSTHLLSQTKKLYFSWDIFRAQAMQYDEASGQYITVDSFPDRYPFTASDDPYGGAVLFLPEPELYEEGRIYPVRCRVFGILDGNDLQDELGECTLFLIAENGGYRVSGRDYTDEELNWLAMSEEERKANEANRKEWLSHDGETQNLGDLDGDGKDDVLRTNRSGTESSYTLLFGGGGELFMKDYYFTPEIGSTDLDGDGQKEIIVLYDYAGTSLISGYEFAILRKQDGRYVQLPLPKQDRGYGAGFPYVIEWEKDYSVTISMEETGFASHGMVNKETESHLYNGISSDAKPISATTYAGCIHKFEIVQYEGKPAIKVYQAIEAPYGKEGFGDCATIFRYEGRMPKALESELIGWEP